MPKKGKKKAARPKHRRRITPAVATAGIDAENGKKELTAQQMIRRLPKYYDPKKDPAMMPVKNIRGGGFAPVTCLNGRQQKILELAKKRSRQPRIAHSKSVAEVVKGGRQGDKNTAKRGEGNNEKAKIIVKGEDAEKQAKREPADAPGDNPKDYMIVKESRLSPMKSLTTSTRQASNTLNLA